MSGSSDPASALSKHELAWMRRALALARRGWGQTAPNPMVGAVVVRDGKVVGEGFHERFGEAHAETRALDAAGPAARGATVYVTLEPCAHRGKTPPCVDALIAAGVRRVVAATCDPSAAAHGGAERLRAAGIEVDVLADADARELNASFLFAASGATRPWVTLKLALSIDGAIARPAGATRWLTGDEARKYVHRLRAQSDAIAVGIGTVLADDPLLTVRQGRKPRVPPLRVIFDRGARLPPSGKLARTARKLPTVVVADQPDAARVAALQARAVEVVAGGAAPAAAMDLLHRRGVRSLFVEGGATVAGALLAAGAVDRLIIFQAPVLLGPGALAAFGGASPVDRLRIIERREFADDLMTVYAVHELPTLPCSPDSSPT